MRFYSLRLLNPIIIRTKPIRNTRSVAPPLINSIAAFPHDASGIPGYVSRKAPPATMSPAKIFNSFFMLL